MGDLDAVDSKIRRLEQEIIARAEPHANLMARLCTIPGIDMVTAWTLLAKSAWIWLPSRTPITWPVGPAYVPG